MQPRLAVGSLATIRRKHALAGTSTAEQGRMPPPGLGKNRELALREDRPWIVPRADGDRFERDMGVIIPRGLFWAN